MECPNPAERDEEGKLPYDVNLRAPEERRRRPQSFAGAAAVTFGSASSSGSKASKPPNQSGVRAPKSNSRHSASVVGDSKEIEVQSPLKNDGGRKKVIEDEKERGASRHLNLQEVDGQHSHPRKRKSKVTSTATLTPDLDLPPGAALHWCRRV